MDFHSLLCSVRLSNLRTVVLHSHVARPRSSVCLVASCLHGCAQWCMARLTVAANPLRTVRESVQLAWLSTVWCGLLSVPTGRSGRICVDPLSNPCQAAAAFAMCRLRSGGLLLQSPTPTGGIPRSLEDNFATVGVSPDASYDEDFLPFSRHLDVLFTHSVLRRVLSRCLDSAWT